MITLYAVFRIDYVYGEWGDCSREKNKNEEIGKKAVAKIQMIEDDGLNQGDSSTNSKSILGQLPKKDSQE